MSGIESKEYRQLARANCYRYGALYIYAERYEGLDKHSFPNYASQEGTGSVEKFLTLIQGLTAQAFGNDPQDKRSKPLPGVQWSGDKLDLSFSLSGTMFFEDYRDYLKCKGDIRKDIVAQGWEQIVSKGIIPGMSLSSYRPAQQGASCLYNEDPVDAAGMAMLASAMQHNTNQAKMLAGYVHGDAQMYAEGKARSEATMAGRNAGIPVVGAITGIGGNIGAGIEAMGANFNSGVAGKWAHAGHPIELLIDGQTAAASVNCVLTDLTLTEKDYVVDDKSGGVVYPTAMEVSLTAKNMYGALYTASSSSNSVMQGN